MSHSHWRNLRARGGRASVDQLIAQSANETYRLNRDDFFDLCDAVRAHTSLLSHQRLNAPKHFCNLRSVLSGLRRLSEYRYRFGRSIGSLASQRSLPLAKQWLGLVNHLIEPYPLPEFLSYDWLTSSSDTWGHVAHLKLADGVSLKQIALPDETFVNKVVARHFMKAPPDAVPMGAVRYAQVMALSEQASREPSVPHARFAMKWIGFSDDAETAVFWDSMVRWVERERPSLGFLKEFYFAVITARFCDASTEFGSPYPDRIIDPQIDIANWSLRRAKRFLANWREDYQASLAAELRQPPCRHRPWRGSAVPDMRFALSDARSNEFRMVEFVQLNTQYQLSVEGQKQSHCVGSYAGLCRRGQAAIFSMRLVSDSKIQRRLTIEIQPKEFAVKTVLGKGNREPTEEEWSWVQRWAQHQCLELV